MRWIALPLAAMMLVAAGPCSTASEGPVAPIVTRPPWCKDAKNAPRRSCLKPWSVFVFMEANSPDLPPIALRHLADMESFYAGTATTGAERNAASTEAADVLVELDVPSPSGIRRLHMERAPKERPRATKIEELASPVVGELPENSASLEERLANFLIWGLREYPAESQVVVVGGRGLGWDPAKAPALARSLDRAVKEANAGRPLSIYVSDACSMQTLEVATEVSGSARFVVGTEQSEQWPGLPYGALIPRINGTVTPTTGESAEIFASPRAIARAIPPLVARAFEGEPPEVKAALAMSAIETEELATKVAPAFGALSAALVKYVAEDEFRAIDLGYVLSSAPRLAGGQRDASNMLARLFELVDREEPRTELVEQTRSAIVAADRAVANVVLDAAVSSAYEPTTRGLSLWLPHDRAELEQRVVYFETSKFFGSTPKGGAPWRAWIDSVLAAPPPPPKPVEDQFDE